MLVREWRKGSSQRLVRTLLPLNRFLSLSLSLSLPLSRSKFRSLLSISSTACSYPYPYPHSYQHLQPHSLQDYYEIVEEGTDGVDDEY